MLSAFVAALPAHDGEPIRPHDVPFAWNLDPFVIVPLFTVSLLYARGWRPADGRPRALAFAAGIGALTLALVSPVEAVAGVLLSAHMVQHVLMISIAAPLLTWSAPTAAIARGLPTGGRRGLGGARRAMRLRPAVIHRLRHPLTRWLLFVSTFWLWHASLLYEAAVEHEWVHAAEHVTFLASALLLWSAVLGPRRARTDRGAAVVVVFLLALQAVFLSALMTFATTPWYAPYASPAAGWDIDPLADQQLAGVVMWVPGGVLHAAIGVALAARWLADSALTPAPSPNA